MPKLPKPPQVSLDLWKSLYRIADKYQALMPWKVLSEDDLFAIHDPVSNNVNYCCVLGEAGEFLGLTLYRGREGLEMHFMLKSNEVEPSDSEIFDLYDSIVVEFCDRKTLEKEDLQLIKTLGSEFSGRKIYPQFRSFLPGSFPWYLTTEEIRLISQALQCAIVHVEHCIKNAAFKNTNKPDHYLLYSPNGQGNEISEWKTSWHKPEPLPPKQFAHLPLNELKIHALKVKNPLSDSPWEVSDSLFPDEIIIDRNRPYILRVGFIVQEASGCVLQAAPLSPNLCHHIALRESVIAAMEKFERIPSKILVQNENSYNALSPLAKALGIGIELRESLPGIDQAQNFLENKMIESESEI